MNPKWTKGIESPNKTGRGKGTPNKTTEQVRQLFASILEDNRDNFINTLEELRNRDPKAYIDVWLKLSERFLPRITQNNLADANGEVIEPIQIVLPEPKKKED
jgi:hypothetical protein